jgi:hypothetical protein
VPIQQKSSKFCFCGRGGAFEVVSAILYFVFLMYSAYIKGDVPPKPWLTEVMIFKFGGVYTLVYHVMYDVHPVSHFRFLRA